MSSCRVCSGPLYEFADFGRQPLSGAFRLPDEPGEEFFYRLAVGICESCWLVQLMEQVPRERVFQERAPYRSSGSSVKLAHFEHAASRFLDLAGPGGFVVELGCHDGVMLHLIADAGTRHLGVEPSAEVAALAAGRGVRVRTDFFDAEVAADIRAEDGPADVIFAADTLCQIPYVDSVLDGVSRLLAPRGIFVFEDPYFVDVMARTRFDVISLERYYYFTARSVIALAQRHDLELVDVERLPVHGGEVRYTLMRPGARQPSPAVAELLAAESAAWITERTVLERFSAGVERVRHDLVALLTRLRDQGRTVAGYGATAGCATVTNYCGIGPDLVPYICDPTAGRAGRLSPGVRIPVHPHEAFASSYPDYALLFAWNNATEVMTEEMDFSRAGGRWIQYAPDVTVADVSDMDALRAGS
jgi:methylation protein EvaC